MLISTPFLFSPFFRNLEPQSKTAYQMTIDEIKEKLASKKSPDRRRAAKEIGKTKAAELGDLLYESYLNERKDTRTWETQVEMIKALGLLEYKNAIAEIEDIVRTNIPHDTITHYAATAYVRLKRERVNDAQPVIELLQFGNICVINGALEVLAFDQMRPEAETIREILILSRDIHTRKDKVVGIVDGRKHLAIACANWDLALTSDFLNHVIATAYYISSQGKPVLDQHLVDVCQNSLKGKFSKAYL